MITPQRDANKEFRKQYELDRQTLYVAHLPRDVDEAELEELFSQAGTVRKCTIVRKDGPSYYGARQQFYAFVEFEHIGEPDEAIRLFVSITSSINMSSLLTIKHSEVTSCAAIR